VALRRMEEWEQLEWWRRWPCLDCFSLLRASHRRLFSLPAWLRSHPLWPDQRSAAPTARGPPCYRQQAARPRAPPCRFSLGFSFWGYLSFCGGRSIGEAHSNRGSAEREQYPRCASRKLFGGTGASCCELSEKSTHIRVYGVRLLQARLNIPAKTLAGNFSAQIEEIRKWERLRWPGTFDGVILRLGFTSLTR